MTKTHLGLLFALLVAGAVYLIVPSDDESISTSQAAVPGTVSVELRGRCEGPDRATSPGCRRSQARRHRLGNRNGRGGGDRVAQSGAASSPDLGSGTSGAERGDRGSGSQGSGGDRGDRRGGDRRGGGPSRNRGNDRSGERQGEHSDSDDLESEDDDEGHEDHEEEDEDDEHGSEEDDD